jgi:hypothetical protein
MLFLLAAAHQCVEEENIYNMFFCEIVHKVKEAL